MRSLICRCKPFTVWNIYSSRMARRAHWSAVLRAGAGRGVTDDELLSALTVAEGVARQLDRIGVEAVVALERREARRSPVAVDQVSERVGLDGSAPAAAASCAVLASRRSTPRTRTSSP